MRTSWERYLFELCSLATAAGREDRVVRWVERWVAQRPGVHLTRDGFGNLMLMRRGRRARSGRRPILITAHLDHPAFVVRATVDNWVTAEFRGGVRDEYFVGSRVRWHSLTPQYGTRRPASATGTIRELHSDPPTETKIAAIELDAPAPCRKGDILTWDLPRPSAEGDLFAAPVCDDLAGAAAALSAFEATLSSVEPTSDVRVLLTRGEEVGFIGAIAACKSGIIPPDSRLLALETSKTFPDAPIGGGPIVRVGDRTSTFDPDLTYRVSQVATQLEQLRPGFAWQRKLMTGGTCEATAYGAYGYVATCLCLALGNYHNMNEEADPVQIGREVISLGDYAGLVRLLVRVAQQLDRPTAGLSLRARLDQRFERWAPRLG